MKYDGEQRQLLRALLECAFLLRPMGWVGKSDLGLEGPSQVETREHLRSSFLLTCFVPRGSGCNAGEDSVEIGRKQAAFLITVHVKLISCS